MVLRADDLAARIKPLFAENFSRFGELGAAVSIWHDGAPLLELHGGYRDAQRESAWTKDTLVLFWSATKGLGSACLLHVLQEHGIGLERRVAEFWPEFAQGGKGEITLAQLLSHQAGLVAFDESVNVLDYAAVVGRWKNSDRSGRPERRTVTMRARSVFFSTNSLGESTRAPLENIGAKFLPNHSVSTSGSDCQPRRMRASRPPTRPRVRTRRPQTPSIAR